MLAPPEGIAGHDWRFKARTAGVFYLLTFLTGVAAVASTPLSQLTVAAYVVNIACYIAVTQLFYDLFKPVNASLALLAALFSLVGCAVQASACAFQIAALIIRHGAPYLTPFTAEQLQALAQLSLGLHAQTYSIGLVFFGAYCLLIGTLVFRSTFLPRTIGVLMAFGGLGWLTFLWPPLAEALRPYNMIAGVLGEGSLTLWLLVLPRRR